MVWKKSGKPGILEVISQKADLDMIYRKAHMEDTWVKYETRETL